MRRLLRLILAAAIFCGGYYVGHLPGSPDLVKEATSAYQRMDRAGAGISARARQQGISLPAAAMQYVLNGPSSVKAERPR